MRTSWHNQRGSITLVALSLAVVIGISLASYLALCQQSLLLSTRTIQLSKARQLAETGLEEALWSLNAAANPNTAISSTAWSNASWSPAPTSSDKSCIITGYDLGNSVTGKVAITITNFNGPTTAPDTAPIIIAAATVTLPGFGDLTKTLRAETKPAPFFANALGIAEVNNGRIIFNSAGLVDSWDSDYLAYAPLGPITLSAPNRNYASTTLYPGTVPATLFTALPAPYTTAALGTSTYPDLSFNYAAVVAAPYITLNNAEIRGYAMTFGNNINITSGSRIMAPPPTPGSTASIPDYARVGKSAFVPDFPVAVPSGNSGNLFAAYTSNDAILNIGSNVWYAPSGLEVDGTLGGASGVTLDVTQPTVIVVQGDLYLHHAGRIKIIPPDGKLEIFVQGNITIGPNSGSTAGFQNDTNQPKRLALYCTGSSRTFQYQSTRDFCGVIYSAAAGSKIQFLAASPNPVIYGAILAKYNIEFDPGMSPQIHYDTALQYLPKGWFKGVTIPFMIVKITETP